MADSTLHLTTPCLSCFQSISTIDFESPVEIVGGHNKLNLLWVHGAISCRKMFRLHALRLAERGYRSVLFDLPGHGTEASTPMTIENNVAHIYTIRKEHCDTPPLAIGGSLGGYMLMETLNQHPGVEDFAGAVVCMASQDVGVSRSFKASVGLAMIKLSTKVLSNETMGSYFLSMAKNVDREVLAELGECGLFFNQPERRAELLKETDCAKGVAKYEGKMLFLNGENDYRDSLELWSKSTKVQADSKLYKGSDHFFSHDRRCVQEFIEDIDAFARKVFQK